ncbi:hypothetical protein ACMGDH_11185 [Sphingomonas sp. DT-207]|uniref:hypothetical protein n=1 Tax=Sphingomonas sp. DT-207 TaxID=3396167 RepID=UPI003F1ADFFB
MTASVQVQYQNATFTANTSTITIGNGGSIELGSNDSLTLEGSFSFGTLNISSGTISFYNQAPGTSVNGNANIPVASSGGSAPTLTANNFSGSVEVQWPTSNGPQYQQLSSGESITLNGFTG